MNKGWPTLEWKIWVTPYWHDLKYHVNKHPMHIDRWNPYRQRCHTPELSREFFNAQNFMHNGVHTTPEFAFIGCIDAPEEIPLGATARISTVGGYEREEYLRTPRSSDDWAGRMRATAKTGAMLKKLLAEVE